MDIKKKLSDKDNKEEESGEDIYLLMLASCWPGCQMALSSLIENGGVSLIIIKYLFRYSYFIKQYLLILFIQSSLPHLEIKL